MNIFVILAAMSTMVQGFLVPPYTVTCYDKKLPPAPSRVERWTSRSSSSDLPEVNTHSSEAALLLALNQSHLDATVLAERKTPAGAYQITRPRWYSKTEVAIILLLVQRWVRVSDSLRLYSRFHTFRCFTGENSHISLPSEMIVVPPQAMSALFL